MSTYTISRHQINICIASAAPKLTQAGTSMHMSGRLPGEKLRRSNEFEGDLIYTYYCSAIRLEGPNFGPVGPPLRMLRPGRSGPLWVSLCSGRAGRGLWVCSVGRADRPGLLPNPGYSSRSSPMMDSRKGGIPTARRPDGGSTSGVFYGKKEYARFSQPMKR